LILIIIGGVISFNSETVIPEETLPIQTLSDSALEIYSVDWSPDGSQLASASVDGVIKIWDTTDWSEIRIITEQGPVKSVSWSPDGSKLATASEAENDNYIILIWDMSNGAELYQLNGHSGPIESVSWSPDGLKLASGSLDTTIKIWDTSNGIELQTLTEHVGAPFSVAWSPDGSKLASGSEDYIIYDTTDWSVLKTIQQQNSIRSVTWSPDGSKLASGADDGSIIIWVESSGNQLRTLTRHTTPCGVDGCVVSVDWSPDGSALVSGSQDGTFIIWDTSDWSIIYTSLINSGLVESVSWSPDGSEIAIAYGHREETNQPNIQIWEYPIVEQFTIEMRFDIENSTTQIGLIIILIGLITLSWAILKNVSTDRSDRSRAIIEIFTQIDGMAKLAKEYSTEQLKSLRSEDSIKNLNPKLLEKTIKDLISLNIDKFSKLIELEAITAPDSKYLINYCYSQCKELITEIRDRIKSHLKAEEDAKVKAEEDAKVKAEETKVKAEEEAKVKAEEEAKVKAEKEANFISDYYDKITKTKFSDIKKTE